MAAPWPKPNEKGEYFHCHSPGPVIDTPFTRISEHWLTQQGGPCGDYELDYSRCAARVGGLRAATECRKFLDDFLECRGKFKTYKRSQIMRAERKKQGRPFLDTPPADAVVTPIGYE